MKRIMALTALTALLFGCTEAEKFASDVGRGVQSTLAGENIVIGYAEVVSPFQGYVTCFKDTPGSAISRQPISHLTQAQGFPSVVVTRTGVLSSGACAELQKNGLLTLTAAAATIGTPPAGSNAFSRTELAGIFDRNPQPGAGRAVAWPRVAITLLEAPSWGWQRIDARNFRWPGFGCWKFKAKVWESERVARDLPTFHRCTDETMGAPSGDNAAYYQTWSGLVGSGSMLVTPGSTGITRTEGPLWPDTPLPVAKAVTRDRVGLQTFNGQAIAAILFATGIDVRQPDHRLWFNLGPGSD